jgi:hypothetical protein
LAPALSGPTRKRAPSKCSTDPPPAATVWINIIGARMRTPATSVSNARSYSPSKCETSVEVPPMSKPIRWENPASRPVSAMPTTPAAGPDKIASLPWNNSAAVRPPDDIMNMRRGAFCSAGAVAEAAAADVPRSPATCATYRRRMGER